MKSKIENLLFEVEKQMIIDIETMKRVGSYKVKKEIFEITLEPEYYIENEKEFYELAVGTGFDFNKIIVLKKQQSSKISI